MIAVMVALQAMAGHFWGIKTGLGAKYHERRQRWRKSDCPRRYAESGIEWKFFVGVPLTDGRSLQGHNQGAYATEEETRLAHNIIAENRKHGDMHILPMRDQYMDISNKLIGIMAYGYWFTNATFIGAHDDEYCLDAKKTLALASHTEGQLLYGGHYKWTGTEYEGMTGPSGMVAPYFNGYALFLERELVRYAIIRNWDKVVLHQEYGTSADDANMGKWVALAKQKYGLNVKLVQDLISDEVG